MVDSVFRRCRVGGDFASSGQGIRCHCGELKLGSFCGSFCSNGCTGVWLSRWCGRFCFRRCRVGGDFASSGQGIRCHCGELKLGSFCGSFCSSGCTGVWLSICCGIFCCSGCTGVWLSRCRFCFSGGFGIWLGRSCGSFCLCSSGVSYHWTLCCCYIC